MRRAAARAVAVKSAHEAGGVKRRALIREARITLGQLPAAVDRDRRDPKSGRIGDGVAGHVVAAAHLGAFDGKALALTGLRRSP